MDIKILHYLKNGCMLLAERSIVDSIVDSNVRLNGDCSVITDGSWIWFENVRHYYEKNRLSLLPEFLASMKANDFIVPIIDNHVKKELVTEFLSFTTPSK